MGKWDGAGGDAILFEGSGVGCSIANDAAFLENSAGGVGGILVVANGTDVSIDQA